MMKKYIKLLFLSVLLFVCFGSVGAKESNWFVSGSYRNSYSSLIHNQIDIGIGYNFKDVITLNAYSGWYINSINSGINYGVFSEVYPLNFFSEKPRKLSPYLKIDYGWLKYGLRGYSNLNRNSGFGYYVGVKYRITNKLSVFLEVGNGARNDFSAGLKYRF